MVTFLFYLAFGNTITTALWASVVLLFWCGLCWLTVFDYGCSIKRLAAEYLLATSNLGHILTLTRRVNNGFPFADARTDSDLLRSAIYVSTRDVDNEYFSQLSDNAENAFKTHAEIGEFWIKNEADVNRTLSGTAATECFVGGSILMLFLLGFAVVYRLFVLSWNIGFAAQNTPVDLAIGDFSSISGGGASVAFVCLETVCILLSLSYLFVTHEYYINIHRRLCAVRNSFMHDLLNNVVKSTNNFTSASDHLVAKIIQFRLAIGDNVWLLDQEISSQEAGQYAGRSTGSLPPAPSVSARYVRLREEDLSPTYTAASRQQADEIQQIPNNAPPVAYRTEARRRRRKPDKPDPEARVRDSMSVPDRIIHLD